jgi:hypothetical protein
MAWNESGGIWKELPISGYYIVFAREAEVNHDKFQQTNKAAGIRLVPTEYKFWALPLQNLYGKNSRNKKPRSVSKLESS